MIFSPDFPSPEPDFDVARQTHGVILLLELELYT